MLTMPLLRGGTTMIILGLLLLVPLPSAGFLPNTACMRRDTSLVLATASADVDDALLQAATERSVPSSELLPLLEKLEQDPQRPISRELVEGTFELIFSSAVASLPLVGGLLDGYLPNKETIRFDLEGNTISLQVETLAFLPSVDIQGENLTYEETTSTLTYTVRGKSQSSTWTILFANPDLLAAKSSVTGLNLIQRIR